MKWRIIVHLLIMTGGRRGEVAGLKWECVDLKKRTILILKALLYSTERGVYESDLKTIRSKRQIKLPAETVDLFRQYRAWQDEQKQLLGDMWNESGYVFTQDTGEPIHPDSINGWLIAFAKRHNLPHLTPHVFRRTHATHLHYGGIADASVARQLGHSRMETTQKYYIDSIGSAEEDAAEAAAARFLRKKKADGE